VAPIEPTAAGVRLRLHIQPRAAATELVGRHGEALKLRVAAPPVAGAANEALVRWLAERLGVARSAVAVTAGATGRRKTISVDGMGVAEASRRLGL
jgi:uncharacterized protein (TIGR00251 family)